MFIKANKALLFRDWKYSKWFIPILILELFLFNIMDLINKDQFGRVYASYMPSLSEIAVIAVTLIIMASVMFAFDRNFQSYSLAASMPFTKREIIVSKWLVGFYNVSIAYFVIFTVMNVLLITNNCWEEYFGFCAYGFICNYLFALCIFGVVLMIQSMSGSVIGGSLFSVLFAAVPYTFIYFIEGIYTRYSSMIIVPKFIEKSSNTASEILTFLKSLLGFGSLSNFSGIMAEEIDPTVSMYGLMNEMINYYGYTRYWVEAWARIIIYTLAILLAFVISLKIFNKSKTELNGKIMHTKRLSRVYKAVIAYYIGFGIWILTRVFVGNTAFRLDYVIVLCLISPILFYFLIGKIIKIYNKHFA